MLLKFVLMVVVCSFKKVTAGSSFWSKYGVCVKPFDDGFESSSFATSMYLAITATQNSPQNDPNNSAWTSWSSWEGNLIDDCGVCFFKRTRSCLELSLPTYESDACPGDSSEYRPCEGIINIEKKDFKRRIRKVMLSHQSKTHSEFSSALKEELSSAYPGYTFTISVYRTVRGGKLHTIIGRDKCHVRIFHRYNRSVVVTFTNDLQQQPKHTEMDVIVEVVSKKGCRAESGAELAWDIAASYEYPIVSIHVVRDGNELHVNLGKNAYVKKFVCERTCNRWWWCTNKESYIVVVFK